MSTLETIAGRIVHVGPYTYDEHCHTYSSLEVEAAPGRLEFKTVMAANELRRGLMPGNDVRMTVLRTGTDAKAKTVILGIYDQGQRRTLVSEEMFKLRAHAQKQAVIFSLMSIVMLPVCFMLFVVPGLIWTWVLWKSWSSVSEFPTAEEIRESVVALSYTAPAMAAT